VSVDIIDQMVAQGVPFAREYGGLLDNRSFGGAQVSRTFYARGQTGQQLLIGAYQQLARQIGLGNVKLWNRMEMVDVVNIDGRCAGIVTRDLMTGEFSSHSAHAVVLATGGYGNVFYLSTNAMACNVTGAWRAHRRGAAFANPCYTQIHPTCIPQADDFQSKLTLMSESLRNDGRIWVPKNADETRPADQIPEEDRDYYLERIYPSFGNLAPRDVSSRAAKRMVDAGQGVGPLKNGVYLDFADAIGRLGKDVIEERYGNLFDMYERITGESPYVVPMRIYPASHYTMGGLWVDYELQTTIPGSVRAGEANFSDHGANRLGCLGADAGSVGRLLRAAVHDRPVPGRPAQQAGSRHEPSRVRQDPAGGDRPVQAVHVDRRHQDPRPLPPRARQDHLGLLRHGPQRQRSREGAVGDPGPARGVQEGPARHRVRHEPQPDAREGGSRRRLLRARHADVQGRPEPRGELRRPLPFRAPDRGRRSGAQRRRLRLRQRLGVVRRHGQPIEHKEQLEYEVVKFQTRSYK
jgi:hypothetical protein